MNTIMRVKPPFAYTLCLIWTIMALAADTYSQVGDGFAITRGPGEREFASAAFDGVTYMVAWGDNKGPGVYVTRVTTKGEVLDPDGSLVSSTGRLYGNQPQIAFGRDNYLVVWHGETPAKVFGARISPTGTILDPGGFIISPLAEGVNQLMPVVSFNGSTYFVVWYGSNATIVGTRVDSDGTVLDPEGITIAWLSEPASFPDPSIATSGASFLTAWAKGPYRNQSVEGARISSQGDVMDKDPISIAPPNQLLPAVSFDNSNYFVAYEDDRPGVFDSRIYGVRISPKGEVLDLGGIPICTAPDSHYFPLVAFDGSNYRVMWTDLRGARNQIWGSRVTQEGEVLDPNGVPISAGTTDRLARALVFGDQNGLLLFKNCAQFPCTQYNIYGLLIERSGGKEPMN